LSLPKSEILKNKALVVSVAQAGIMLGCGHDSIYDLIHANELRSFLIGRRRKILLTSVEAYLAKCVAAAEGGFQKVSNPPPVPPLGPRKRRRKSRGR